jgi:hypothetical protein
MHAYPHHAWLPRLCDRLSQTTDAQHQVHDQITTLDNESAIRLTSVVEELLRELDLTTMALGQRESI